MSVNLKLQFFVWFEDLPFYGPHFLQWAGTGQRKRERMGVLTWFPWLCPLVGIGCFLDGTSSPTLLFCGNITFCLLLGASLTRRQPSWVESQENASNPVILFHNCITHGKLTGLLPQAQQTKVKEPCQDEIWTAQGTDGSSMTRAKWTRKKERKQERDSGHFVEQLRFLARPLEFLLLARRCGQRIRRESGGV